MVSKYRCANYLLYSHDHERSESYFVGNKAKARISKRVFQENKARQIFRKTNISCLLIRTRTCVYQEVRNVRFSENLACLVFLKHPFWDSPFWLGSDDFPFTFADLLNKSKIRQLLGHLTKNPILSLLRIFSRKGPSKLRRKNVRLLITLQGPASA